MCVCGGGGGGGGGGGRDEAISKLKGAGATRALPRSYLACVLPSMACSLDCLTKANPDGIFLILNANSVRNSLEANSEFRCKCISKFIHGHSTGPPPPRIPTTEG